MWCEEKLGRIRRGLEDLARRKNPNHPGYKRAVSDITRYLTSWPVVNSWHGHPPRRSRVS